MDKPIVSIIVPVYNVEKYLRQCLDSILTQTFTDWECILVDDGSTDQSGGICDEYATKDSRFVVVHKENGGVSTARNRGLNVVNGEWVTFMDSDDWVTSDFLTAIAVHIREENLDCIKWGYHLKYPRTEKTKCLLQDEYLKQKSLFFVRNEETEYDAYVWNTLYNKRLLQGLQFDESINWCEDHIFTSEYYIRCREILLLAQSFYHHRVGFETSLSLSVKPEMMLKASQRLIELRTILVHGDQHALNMICDYARHAQYRALLHLYSRKNVYKERYVFCLQLNNVYNDSTGIDRAISEIINSNIIFRFKDIALKICLLIRKVFFFLKRSL